MASKKFRGPDFALGIGRMKDRSRYGPYADCGKAPSRPPPHQPFQNYQPGNPPWTREELEVMRLG
jgi:hypothetical protein